MDHAITDPALDQFDSGAMTNLEKKGAKDQVSFGGGMSTD